MRGVGRLHREQRGSAGAEFALVLPMLLVLLFAGLEAGHFIWTQHKLAEGVRDGARFAARMNINDVCGTSSVVDPIKAQVRLLTRTGQLADANARPRVPGWTDGQVVVDFPGNCQAFMPTGIYSDLGRNGPLVTVTATNVAYPSLFQSLGVLSSTIQLTAKSNAAVTGL